MRVKLTEWIVLKILVAEHSRQSGYEPAPIYSQSDRDAFMESRRVPDFLRIYFARHNSLEWQVGYHRRASGLGTTPPLLPPPRIPTSPRNVQATTWGIGKLLIYVAGCTEATVASDVRFIKDSALRRLWPLTSTDLLWPPPQLSMASTSTTSPNPLRCSLKPVRGIDVGLSVITFGFVSAALAT